MMEPERWKPPPASLLFVPMLGFSAGVCCHLLGTSNTTEPGPNWGPNPGPPFAPREPTPHPRSSHPSEAQRWLWSQTGPKQGQRQHPTSLCFSSWILSPPPRRCYNCGGLDHHAKECKLPPQPKKCHFCQSISHMVANCPAKAQQSPSSQGKPAYFREEEDMHSSGLLPETRE